MRMLSSSATLGSTDMYVDLLSPLRLLILTFRRLRKARMTSVVHALV
jgi:hypothetical protein